MSVEEEISVDELTGKVLLGEDCLRDWSFVDLLNVAICRGVDVGKAKTALECGQAIVAYVMYLLSKGLPATESRWRPPKRAKVEVMPNHQTVNVSR